MLAWGKGALLEHHNPECQILSPEEVISSRDVSIKKVAIGNYNSCALLSDGTLRTYRKVEGKPVDVKEKVTLGDIEVVDIFAGGDHVFAIDKVHKIYGWGSNDEGQLGLPDEGDFVVVPTPIKYTSAKKVVQVACGQSHSLMLMQDGTIFGMGDNTYGQLGLMNKCPVNEPACIRMLRSLPISQIVAGGWHSFCVTMSGRTFSWGRNDFGQLGVNDNIDHASPRLVKKSTEYPVAYISAGDFHSVILTKKGKILTFGRGSSGQLGQGRLCENELIPKQVEELERSIVTQIACGRNHTVAFVPDCGQIFAFGDCNNGQIGVGKKVDKITEPEMVGGPWCDPAPVGKCDYSETTITTKVKEICAAGDQTYLLVTTGSPEKGPLDYRDIEHQRRIATINKNICNEISNLDKEGEVPKDMKKQLVCIFSSQSCLNGSFSAKDRVINMDHHALDIADAERCFAQICECKNDQVIEIIVEALTENMLPHLVHNPLNENMEALQIYISLPILISHLRCPKLKGKLFFPLVKKLSSLKLKTGPWKILERWYMSSKSEFATIVKLCCRLIADGLLNSVQIQPDADAILLRLIKKLHKLNSAIKMTSYKSFYLPCGYTRNAIKKQHIQLKQDTNPLFFSHSFLFDAKAKTTMLFIDAEYRKLYAKIQGFYNADQSAKIRLVVNRATLVSDTIRQLRDIEDLQRPLCVSFQGEVGIDDGALSKEFFMLVLQEVAKPEYYMFYQNEDSNIMWFSDNHPDTDDTYSLVGTLFGLALYNHAVVNMNFPLALFKKLLGFKPDLNDFMELDPVFGKNLQGLTVEELHTLTTRNGTPLKKNGENIALTPQNKDEYVELYVDFIFNKSVEKQFKYFNIGFSKVCFGKIFRTFRPEELMEMVAEKQHFKWKKVKKCSIVERLSDSFDQVCIWFWEVVHEMTREDEEKFLVFLTGSNKMPITGLDPVMTIQERLENDDFLPVAHTCYNTLQLACYSSKEVLDERLKYAIECKGFHIE